MAHWLSGGRRLEGEAAMQVKRAVSRGTFATLRELASRIRRRRQRTSLKRMWVAGRSARGPVPLQKALRTIAIRNEFGAKQEGLMRRVVKRALEHLPDKVQGGWSFRLLKGGRYLSINGGSNLVLRTPVYSAGGQRHDGDVLLIWPRSRRISTMTPREWRGAAGRLWRFSRIPYCWIPLSFQEALSLRDDEWQEFGTACEEAARLRRARVFVSNVKVQPREGKAGGLHF
jgi:hypothetical protein